MRCVVAVKVVVMVTACGGKPATSRVAAPPVLTPTSRVLVQNLAEIDRFMVGPGRWGLSRGEELTLALAHELDAIEAFSWLGGQLAPVPRLYAYWALRTLAPDRAAALAPRLRQERRRIEWQRGCIVSPAKVARIIDYLESDDLSSMPDPRRARGANGHPTNGSDGSVSER